MDFIFIFILVVFGIFTFISISKDHEWKQLEALFKRKSKEKLKLKFSSFGFKEKDTSKVFFSSLVKVGIVNNSLIISHIWPLQAIFCDLEIPLEGLNYVGRERLAL